MGKIYKLSNGKTVTVLPEDESDFLQKTQEQGLTATLELNPNTEYDAVPGGLTKKELAKSKLKNFSQKLKNTKERTINWLNPKVDQWGEAKDAEPEVVEPLNRELDLTNITGETPDSMLQDINVVAPQLNKYDYNGETYVKIKAPGFDSFRTYDDEGMLKMESERAMVDFFVLESEAKDKGLIFDNINGTEINIPEVENTFGWTEIYGMDSANSFRPYFVSPEIWDNAPDKQSDTTSDRIISNNDITSYVIGDGYDFAWTSPDQFINLNNAPDYWNLRSEASVWNNQIKTANFVDINSNLFQEKFLDLNKDGIIQYDEKINAIQLYGLQWNEYLDLYENKSTPDSLAPLGQYQLYGQHYSGYLSFDIYGHISNWDEKDHLRNKEVRDKVFAGTHAYNPATDELVQLETPIEVKESDVIYSKQQNTSFQNYNDFVKKNYTNEVFLDNNMLIKDFNDWSHLFPNSVSTYDDYSPGQVDARFDHYIFSYSEEGIVDAMNAWLYKNGWQIFQSNEKGINTIKLYSEPYARFIYEGSFKTDQFGQNRATITWEKAKEMATTYIEVGYSETNEKGMRKAMNEFNEYIKKTSIAHDSYNLGTLDDALLTLSDINIDERNYINMTFEKSLLEFSNLRESSQSESGFIISPNKLITDKDLLDYYSSSFYNDTYTKEDEPFDLIVGTEFISEGGDVASRFGETVLELGGVKFDSLDSVYTPLTKRETKFEILTIGASYDEANAYQKIQSLYSSPRDIIGGGPDMNISWDELKNNPDYKHAYDRLISSDAFKGVLVSLYEDEVYLKDKKDFVQTQFLNNQRVKILTENVKDQIEKSSAYLFSEGEWKGLTEKAINKKVQENIVEYSEGIIKLDIAYNNITEVHDNIADIEKQIADMPSPNEFMEQLTEKYPQLKSQWFETGVLTNAVIKSEISEYELEYSNLYNQLLVLVKETLPANQKIYNEAVQELDKLAIEEVELDVLSELIGKKYAPGTYYGTNLGAAIWDTVYGGFASLTASTSDIAQAVFEKTGILDKESIGFKILQDIEDWADDFGNDVKAKSDAWRSDLRAKTTWNNVRSAGDMFDYLFTSMTEYVPIITIAMLSKGRSLSVMFTYTAAEKYDHMRRENNLYVATGGKQGESFTFLEMFSNAMVTGLGEAFWERVTFGQIRALKYFKTRPGAVNSFKKEMMKSCRFDKKFANKLFELYGPKGLLGTTGKLGFNMSSEAFSEVMTQITENYMDVLTGVDGATFFDGIDEAAINGAFLSGFLHSPVMFKSAFVDPFVSQSTNARLSDINIELIKLTAELDSKNITDKRKEQIQKEFDNYGVEIELLLTRDCYKVDLLSNKQKRRLIEIHEYNSRAKKEIDRIWAHPTMSLERKTKEALDIQKEVENNTTQKQAILDTVKKEDVDSHYENVIKAGLSQLELVDNIPVELVETNNDGFITEEITDTQDGAVTREEFEDVVLDNSAQLDAYEEAIEKSNDAITNAKSEIENIKENASNNIKNIKNNTKIEGNIFDTKIQNLFEDINKITNDNKISQSRKTILINGVKIEIDNIISEKNDFIKEQTTLIEQEQTNKKEKVDEQKEIINKEKENKDDARNKIAIDGDISRNVFIGNNILSTNAYGKMVPIYNKDTNQIEKLKIVINKEKAIKDGAWATVAHEITHAIFANTLKSDPAMRVNVGGAIDALLDDASITFKNDPFGNKQNLYNKKIAQYNINHRGEEKLALISELLVKDDVQIESNILTDLADMFRRWSMNTFGIDYKFNNANDIKNFLKDYSYSIKKNRPSKAIARLMEKGAKGTLFENAKTAQDKESLITYSMSTAEWMKNNPEIVNKYDKHTRNEDGSKKYKNKKEWQERGQADNVAVWQYIAESGKGSLDSRILEEQGDFDPKGLPFEAQQDYIRKVKDNLQERWLKNFDPSKNESAAGYLFGKNGVLYHAKKDVSKDYVEKEGGTGRRSIDRQTTEGQSYVDILEADKDRMIDEIENSDMSTEIKDESIKDVRDLTMVMEMLNLPNDVKQAVKQNIASADVILDGLTYKGIRGLILSMEGKATSEKNVVPTGPLFETLNAISTEFGVDPLRILAKQDLNGAQRKAAQEYIFSQTTNEDGSYNENLFNALPEGQDRDGRATGIANTKLGQFYTKGERLTVKEGARKDLGQKFAQDKRVDVTKEELLDLFGINADGSLQPGTKADGAIRELIIQIAQLAANQEIRLNAVQNNLASSSIIAKLKDGKSETMYSQAFDNNPGKEFNKLKQAPTETFETVKMTFVDEKGVERESPFIDPTAISQFAKDRDGNLLNITQQEHIDQATKKYLELNPQDYNLIYYTTTGSITRTIHGTKAEFEAKFGKIPKNKNGKEIKQSYYPRNKYTSKKYQTKNTIKKIKEDIKNNRPLVLYKYYKNLEIYLKDNPNDFVVFNEILRNTTSNQSGAYTRIQVPSLFYVINKDGNIDLKVEVVEEHASAQKEFGNIGLNAARANIVDNIWPILEAGTIQGALPKIDDTVVNGLYKHGHPEIYYKEVTKAIIDGKLSIDPRLSTFVRYAVPQQHSGKTKYINLNNLVWAPTGKTVAQEFGVNITAKQGDITPTIIEFQNNLVVEVATGKITKDEAAETISQLEIDGINSIDKVSEKGVTTAKLNDLLNNRNSKDIKEVKGMSTFDFDDTLARTKSGVRYTMPNNTGESAVGRKVIFLAGSAGSGKSNVVKQLDLEGQGYKIVNQDISLEWLVKNSGLPTNMRDFTPEQASKWGSLQWEARDIAQRKQMKFKGRGDGVVVDGTGASTISMFTQVQKFKDAGYDVQMIFVDSSLETALKRNRAREERSLKDFIVERNWKAVQKNKKAFKEEFGKNFAEINTNRLKQGSPLPKGFVNKINDFSNSYIKGRLTAEEFASRGGELLDQGATFDFSEFNKVVDGTPGPLLEKARKRAKKFGTKDMFVLTARPQESAFAIQQFLKGQGLDIPIKNITGLANSTGDAKAQWMLDKFAEGYNDMYFVDDAIQNVDAVKNVLDQLDIKSKVVQAKLNKNNRNLKPGNDASYSKIIEPDPDATINREFNEMIERKKGVAANKRFSSAEARKRGAKWKFDIYIPPSAEDFKGLMYYFLGKGKQGEADLRFFENTLFKPFAKGIRNWNNYKQNMVNEYNALRKRFPNIKLNNKVPNTSFTNDTAIRVYLWNKMGVEIPGISKSLQTKLVNHVNKNPNIKAFANGLSILTRRKEGYVNPSKNWMMESIPTDLRNVVDKIGRKEFLQEWVDNKDIIFSKENLNKIEAIYGTSFRSALEDILYRMEFGGNRKQGSNKMVNDFTDWINGSIGAIMFFNMRSALLQTMSTVNFINWSDNNMFKASAAFANQPQFWKDFVMLFNSPQLKQRRKGLQTDVSAAELTKTFAENGYNPATVVSYLLQKGFLPTQIADSFAIAFGGASFYRNRYNKYIKQGMSPIKAKERTMLEFQEIAEETQQSSREDLVSQQQASVLGRLILAFQNVTMQYGRLNKKALSDLVNRRGDMKTNISKILFYGFVNNIIFAALQNGLAFMMWGEDEEDIDDRTTRTFNSALDSFLRGTGLYGALVSTLKNTIIQWHLQSKKGYGQDAPEKIILEVINLSPPIGSKVRKIMNAYYSEKYNKGIAGELGFRIENPQLQKWASIIEATTNIPLMRLLNKANNLEEAITGNHETWKRIAMFLGWNRWQLGIEDEEVVEAKEAVKEKKEAEKKKEKEEKKAEEEKEKIEEKKKEEEEKKEKGIKTIRCSGIRSNGERCGNTTETADETWLCVHHKPFIDGSDTDGDGIKEYRCIAIKSNGDRCKNKTENKNKKCYAHQ